MGLFMFAALTPGWTLGWTLYPITGQLRLRVEEGLFQGHFKLVVEGDRTLVCVSPGPSSLCDTHPVGDWYTPGLRGPPLPSAEAQHGWGRAGLRPPAS